MEWLAILGGAILALLVLRSFVLACFPDGRLAQAIEFEISSYGGFDNSSCGDSDSGGGDGGGD